MTGGADFVVQNERDLLVSAGHEVDQFFVENAEEVRASKVRQGLKAVWNATALREFADAIARGRPDVVHVHTPFPLLSPGVFQVAHRRDVPVVTTSHSFRYSCIKATCYLHGEPCERCVGTRTNLPGVIHRCYKDSVTASAALAGSLFLHRLGGTFARAVTRYIVLSEFARNLLVRDGFPAHKIVVKPNSVADPAPDRETRDRRSIVFVGRLEPEKGIRTLLEGWARVRGDVARLTVLGDGSLRPAVEAAATSDPSIEFHGWASRTEIVRRLAGAAYLVMPSEWYEGGFPLVAMEALATGTPVLISDVANSSGVVRDGDVGYVYRARDPDSLARGIERALAATEEPAMQVRARRVYETLFTQDRNLASLVRLYTAVLRERKEQV